MKNIKGYYDGLAGTLENSDYADNDALKAAMQDIQDAESHIRDADMAREMSRYTRESIMGDSVTAIMAQARQRAGRVLDLLRG